MMLKLFQKSVIIHLIIPHLGEGSQDLAEEHGVDWDPGADHDGGKDAAEDVRPLGRVHLHYADHSHVAALVGPLSILFLVNSLR